MLALVAAASRSRAEYRDWMEDRQDSSRSLPSLRYIETDAEADRENFQPPGSGSEKSTLLYVSPRLGVGWNNYIYHPNLMTYSLLLEPGYLYQERTFNGQTSTTDQFVLEGIGTANFLQFKPYATSASFSKSHEEVKYDFFNTAIVDAQSWGVFSGYRDGPVPVTTSFLQSHEDSDDFSQITSTDQNILNVNAHNERKDHDLTDLSYQFNEFNRETQVNGSTLPNDNTLNHVSLTDTEHFSKSLLQSTFRFDERNAQTTESSDINATVNYSVDHSSTLSSYYDYSLSQFSDPTSDSLLNYGVVGITHRLYESLVSGLDVHGSTFNSSTGDSTLDYLSGGTTGSENYTKGLGGWSRLSLNDTASYNYTDQHTSGSEVLVPNESHVVPLNNLVILNQPRAIALISVTSANNIPLQEGLDYVVNESTDPWQIQILNGGPSHIQPGMVILVTYTVQTNPSGNYSTVANVAQIRWSFRGDLVSVYAQYSFVKNQASSPEFLLQDDQLFRTGMEFNWHALHLTADYQDEHSTFFDNQGFSLGQGYSMNLPYDSTLGVDLSQQWLTTTYNTGPTNQTQNLTFYNFLLHYQYRITAGLTWAVEGGYRQQRGFEQDQDLFAARTYLNWIVGQLQVHLGYEHENQLINNEKRDRDFGFIRVRRTF
jgi:hypothetical protein